MSPSLKAAFVTPTLSDPPTAGSADSSRTVRGFDSGMSGHGAAGTPSYPFPFVPSTGSRSYTQQHQPFTALSPTTSFPDSKQSQQSASAASSATRARPVQPSQVDSRASSAFAVDQNEFPCPNLYEIVLELNSDPNLDVWWSHLSAILQQWYKVERATASLPADPSDIENVPWAQKASFDVVGLKHRLKPKKQRPESTKSPKGQERFDEPSRRTQLSDAIPKKQNSKKLKRPPIESRHSYAGYETAKPPRTPDVANISHSFFDSKNVDSRPTQSAGKQPEVSSRESLTAPLTPKETLSESVGSRASTSEECCDGNPVAKVFTSLRTLDSEKEPLLNSTSVNWILERNKPVTLTREYSSNQQQPPDDGVASLYDHPHPRNALYVGRRDPSSPQYYSRYEEHEQVPASPWSQSPAPSPAIQADPEENPFFVGAGHVEEESFRPSASVQDYSRYGQVEAIGVDKASTVIHIPLVHPMLSKQINPATRISVSSTSALGGAQDSVRSQSERKAPIAILSVLSRTVPFPQPLFESLKFLGPHLATSLHMCMQAASLQALNSQIMRRPNQHGRCGGADTPSSLTGSLASPFEYSPRSKFSPATSDIGTPTPSFGGMLADPQSHDVQTSTSYNVSESGDSYFAIKAGSSQQKPSQPSASQKSSNTSVKHQDSTHASGTKPRSYSSISTLNNAAPGEVESITQDTRAHTMHNDQNIVPTQSAHKTDNEKENGPRGVYAEKRHTMLHSHGADFAATFQSLPAAAGAFHGRSVSLSDKLDMPPPSDSLIRTIIDALPCQIFTANPITGSITWVNSKYLAYSGHKPPEILARPWRHIHPNDRKEYLDEWRDKIVAVNQFQRKVRLRRFDLEYRWFYVRAVPLRDKAHNVVHWIGTYVDIHEQHLAEMNAAKQHETAASESKYRALANSSPQIVFSATKQDGLTFCNNQWVEYSGQATSQALGVGFMDFVHPDDLIKCKLPSFDDSDSTRSNVPISMPILSGRKSQAGSTGASSEESDDSSTTFAGLPRPTDQLPQRKLSELAGKGILRVSKDVTGKPSYSTEVRLKTKDGEYRWHMVRVMLTDSLLQPEDKQEIWYGSCSDINDHKQLETQLKETMNAKSQFLSNMSHEIRTPLNGIYGNADLLMGSALTEQQLEQVNVCFTSARRLLHLVNDILDLSKMEKGMMGLNMGWLHLRPLIEEVNASLGSTATDKGIDLNYVMDEDVPTTLKGDKQRIYQVLSNIVGNAIKFTKIGEVLVRCNVYRGEDPELLTEPHPEFGEDYTMVEFKVSDTGRGFTDVEKERLFKRFSQIDSSSTRQHEGTGLGLAISKNFAELHGGTMIAHGDPGKGSTFSFSIKLGKSQEIPEPQTKSSHVISSQTVFKVPKESGAKSAQVSPRSVPPFLHDEMKQSPLSIGSPEHVSPLEHMSKVSKSSSATTGQSSLSEKSTRFSSKASSTSSTDAQPGFEIIGKEAVRVVTPAALYSILVICPLGWAREATIKHLETALPEQVPRQITAKSNVADAKKMIRGDHHTVFTHIAINMQSSDEIASLVHQTVQSHSLSSTTILLVSDPRQVEGVASSPGMKFDQLTDSGRIRVVYKPLKPSQLFTVFDPKRAREMSTDLHMMTAQQIADREKKLLDDTAKRIGDRDVKILTIEDNTINQQVCLCQPVTGD